MLRTVLMDGNTTWVLQTKWVLLERNTTPGVLVLSGENTWAGNRLLVARDV